ncbi:serine hydrolase [Microbacterium sp. Kw_RZR3]|uniref:serine hydrolase domain-containing protein n=1 Tax=Microbacterium sp. Kw_RZR3 TaxID=3032903 RepID=UPI0023DAAAFF|nr:serine hydrolase domain-containing protein [Microbacterium sp. Kw_RZR3]MDF2046119.1 serine hydrolase [Microbacterium sp. Kw_RZR3]
MSTPPEAPAATLTDATAPDAPATALASGATTGDVAAAGDARRDALLRAGAAYVAQWIGFQHELRGVPGIQVAIRHRGELLLDEAWGVANAATSEPLTTGHLFRIASHSKTFTATAVLQLVESGALRLDDPLSRWLPELADAEVGDVSVRELLGHQGGVIRDGVVADFWQRGLPFPDRAEILRMAAEEGRVFAPNEHFKYSNVGYSLLGLVIEAAAGVSYAQYVVDHIVRPLGLDDLGPEWDADRADDFAAGHNAALRAGAPRRVIPHVDTRAMAAATGWFGTARDLSAYFAAHTPGDDTLVSDAAKRLLQRRESDIEYAGVLRHYGLGFDVRDLDGVHLVGHSGGYPGHITRTWLDLDDDIVVSVLTNAIDGPADVLATGAIGILRLALAQADREPAAAAVTGRFASMWSVADLVDLGGAVAVLHPADPDPARSAEVLDVDDDGTLRLPSRASFGASGEPVSVERDAAGEVVSIRLSGMSMWPFERYRYALSTEQPSELLKGMAL